MRSFSLSCPCPAPPRPRDGMGWDGMGWDGIRWPVRARNIDIGVWAGGGGGEVDGVFVFFEVLCSRVYFIVGVAGEEATYLRTKRRTERRQAGGGVLTALFRFVAPCAVFPFSIFHFYLHFPLLGCRSKIHKVGRASSGWHVPPVLSLHAPCSMLHGSNAPWLQYSMAPMLPCARRQHSGLDIPTQIWPTSIIVLQRWRPFRIPLPSLVPAHRVLARWVGPLPSTNHRGLSERHGHVALGPLLAYAHAPAGRCSTARLEPDQWARGIS